MRRWTSWMTLCAAALALSACNDPLTRDTTQSLRDQIVIAQQRELKALAQSPTTQPPVESTKMYLDKDPDRIKKLDEISGPAVYLSKPIHVGPDLNNKPTTTVSITLEQAIRKAVEHNLTIESARLAPAISESALASAEAAFDAVFFTDIDYSNLDQPRTATVIGGTPVSATTVVQNTSDLTTGIRKPLDNGGQLTLSTGYSYDNNKTPGFNQRPDPAWTSNITLGLNQPLLRNFGTYINRSRILLAKNAHRTDVLQLHTQLLNVASDVEQAYWNLVFARRQLAIQQHLLQMTIDTRDTIFARADFDVNPVQKAQAQAYVEDRQSDLIRAELNVRATSDTLKKLMNDPELPLSGETLIVPVDDPVEMPLSYNLLDEVTQALQNRPDVRQALLAIDNASIRQAVADNQRLPMLDLNAQIVYRGLDNNVDQSYSKLTDGKFIDYLIGAKFEAPIGNRAAEADYRRTQLQRQSAVIDYRTTVQTVVMDVKTAMRQLTTSYRLIAVSRAARRAAAENLRALLEREQRGEALTPEFLLDLKLTTQQRLANDESQELQAVIDYNNAIAKLYHATGTLLERNQIDMHWPKGMFADQK